MKETADVKVKFLCLFSSANKCLLKVGHYSAQLEQYQKAIEIYEQVTDCYTHFAFINAIILSYYCI